jgi:hypothetical protein
MHDLVAHVLPHPEHVNLVMNQGIRKAEGRKNFHQELCPDAAMCVTARPVFFAAQQMGCCTSKPKDSCCTILPLRVLYMIRK